MTSNPSTPPQAGRAAPLRFELRDPAATANYWQRGVACLVGLVVASLVLVLDPQVGLDSLSAIWRTTLGTQLGATQLVQLSTGLVVTGCAFAVAFRAKIWNIGMEGQLLMGAWSSTFVAFEFPNAEPQLLIPGMLLAGIAGGALYALVPALLKAYIDVNEIITTLMFNLIALLWLAYWVTGRWRRSQGGAGTLESDAIPESAQFGSFTIGEVEIGYGMVLAVAVAFVLAALFRYTVFGYRVKFIGSSVKAAKYAGVPVRRYTMTILVLSGSIAGLAGSIMLMDFGNRYSVSLSNNTGYLGVVVGAAAAGSLMGSVAVALLVGFLVAAGSGLRLYGVSGNAVLLLVGMILMSLALSDVLARYRVVRPRGKEAPRFGGSNPQGNLNGPSSVGPKEAAERNP